MTLGSIIFKMELPFSSKHFSILILFDTVIIMCLCFYLNKSFEMDFALHRKLYIYVNHKYQGTFVSVPNVLRITASLPCPISNNYFGKSLNVYCI